jgi:hemoglobin
VERLAAYWGEALGGPPDYSSLIADHSTVLRMHAGNGEHADLDERAVELFVQALDDADVTERVRPALVAWFRDAVAEMARFPGSAADVPAGLPFPRWSWDGPVT